MDAIPVPVCLSLLGFSKGSNQLKRKDFLNIRQKKIENYKKVLCKTMQWYSLQSRRFAWHGVMLFTHTVHACAGKGKMRPVGDWRLSIRVENKFKWSSELHRHEEMHKPFWGWWLTWVELNFLGGGTEELHFFPPNMVLVFLIPSDSEKERAEKERDPTFSLDKN